jgi:hypothetical protein
MYAPKGQIQFRERLRLKALVTAARELFAWPGSIDFTTEPLESWISIGAVSTGSFATEIHNLFMGSGPTVKYGGIETRDQQMLYRFDFHAPLLNSRNRLSVNGKSAITAYSGSFWVSKDSLDLVRLETRAEEIPIELDCRESRDSVTYGRTRLGVDETLLPSCAETVLVTRDGRESRNSVGFSNCRPQKTGRSVSSNTTSEPAMLTDERPQAPVKLPSGIALVVRLEQPVSIGESAAGDELVARLDKAVNSGSVSLPKGTPVLGRIRHLEEHFSSPPSNLIGFQFFAAQPPGGRITFSARLTGPRATEAVVRDMGDRLEVDNGSAGLDIENDGRSTGVGTFRVPGKTRNLPRGFRTVWETQ